MPGIISHYICAEAVLKKTGTGLGEMMERNRGLYNIGAQGPDIFFYYLPGFAFKGLFELGGEMHSGKFGDFLSSAAESMNAAEGAEKEAIAAYLCGYLTHYALDANTHPYVYYKAGFVRPGEKGGKLRWLACHWAFETALDVLMLDIVKGEKPAGKKLSSLVSTGREERAFVEGVIARGIRDAYGINVSGRSVRGAMKYMARLTRIMQSKKGRRKKLMESAEKLLLRLSGGFCACLIHPQEITDGIDYLNISKKQWSLPWDKTRVKNDSFPEMFEKAVDDGVEMTEALYMHMKGEIGASELLAITGDKSFSTGMDAGAEVIFNNHASVFE